MDKFDQGTDSQAVDAATHLHSWVEAARAVRSTGTALRTAARHAKADSPSCCTGDRSPSRFLPERHRCTAMSVQRNLRSMAPHPMPESVSPAMRLFGVSPLPTLQESPLNR